MQHPKLVYHIQVQQDLVHDDILIAKAFSTSFFYLYFIINYSFSNLNFAKL